MFVELCGKLTQNNALGIIAKNESFFLNSKNELYNLQVVEF
jgi:hypothetical protein